MATSTPSRSLSWTSIGIGALIVVALGVGVPYGLTNFVPDKHAPPPDPPRAAAAAVPPKIEYLGASTVSGASASLVSDPKQTTQLAPDDAMIVWLKVTSANGQAPPPGPGTNPAGVGGGGRGGRRMRLPIRVKDEAGRIYAAVPERKEGGLVALHLKKGYDKKPSSLKIEEFVQDKVIGTWEVKDVPAPTLVLADNSLQGAPLGEVQLHEGRFPGQVVSSIHLTMPVAKDQGVILTPVAASYLQIDSTRQTPIISEAGKTPVDSPLNVPNAGMARRVSFDMKSYEGVRSTETVTFHSARIESRFGQPTFVVDKDEIVTTPSGLKVKLNKQDHGPGRAPRHVRPEVPLEIDCDCSAISNAGVEGVAPTVTGQLVNPPLAEFGLTQMNLSFYPTQFDGEAVFDLGAIPPKKMAAGTLKFGPIKDLSVLITIIKPKIVSTKRIVLPVNPKVLPAPARGGGGRPMAASASTL